MTAHNNDDKCRTAAQHTLTEHLRLTTAGRTDEWVELFTTDAVLEFPYAPDGMPRRLEGKEALYAHMVNFPKTFEVKFTNLVFHDAVDPHLVIAEFRLKGMALPTGKPYEQTCISVIRTNDDALITHYLDYWNPLVAIEALKPSDESSNSSSDFKFGD